MGIAAPVLSVPAMAESPKSGNLITHFNNQAFGRFFADTRQAHQCLRIIIMNTAVKFFGALSG